MRRLCTVVVVVIVGGATGRLRSRRMSSQLGSGTLAHSRIDGGTGWRLFGQTFR